jgi:hypothetical protein
MHSDGTGWNLGWTEALDYTVAVLLQLGNKDPAYATVVQDQSLRMIQSRFLRSENIVSNSLTAVTIRRVSDSGKVFQAMGNLLLLSNNHGMRCWPYCSFFARQPLLLYLIRLAVWQFVQ